MGCWKMSNTEFLDPYKAEKFKNKSVQIISGHPVYIEVHWFLRISKTVDIKKGKNWHYTWKHIRYRWLWQITTCEKNSQLKFNTQKCFTTLCDSLDKVVFTDPHKTIPEQYSEAERFKLQVVIHQFLFFQCVSIVSLVSQLEHPLIWILCVHMAGTHQDVHPY